MLMGRAWRSRLPGGRTRSLGGSLVATGAGQALLTVSGVLIARTLGPQDRGYLALLVVVSGICVLVGGAGLPTAVTYYIAQNRAHTAGILRVLAFPALVQVSATAVVQFVVLFVLVAHDPQRVKLAALISLLLVPGILGHSYGLAILQGQERFRAFNVLRVLPTAAYAACVVAAIVAGAGHLVVLMLAWAGALCVGGAVALTIGVRGLRSGGEAGGPSRKELMRFGAKSLVGSVSPIEALRLDQALVGLLLTPVALGYYVVGQAFTNFPRAVAYSVGTIAYPHLASTSDPALARRTMWRYFFLGIGLSVLVIGLLELAAGRLIAVFFGAEFQSATAIARMLLLATLFMAARRLLTDCANGLGRPGLGTIGEVASWIFLVPAVAVLLPRYDAVGVAAALALSWLASLLLLIVLVGMPAARLSALRAAALHTVGRGRSFLTRTRIAAAASLAVAVGAGSAVAAAPAFASIAVVIIGAATLFFAFARSAMAFVSAGGSHRVSGLLPADADAGTSDDDVDEDAVETMRLPRAIYYAGSLMLGLLTFRAGGQVTYSDVLFLVGFMFAGAELVLVRRRVPLGLPALLLVGMGLFALGGFASTFGAVAPLKSGAVVLRLIFLTVFWFWLGVVVLERRAHVRRAISLWVLSAALTGAAGLLQLAAGDVIPNTHTVFGRSTGFTGQPNDLGGITAVALVPALMLATRASARPSRRSAAYLVVLLVGGGLIASGSVGALAAAGIAAFVWLALERMSLHSWLLFAGATLCVVGVVTVQHSRGAPTPIDRVIRVTTPADAATAQAGGGSVDSRVTIYHSAARRIRDDPFIGVGLDLASITKPFGVVSYQYDVHNIVIGTWYEAGLLGAGGMLLALFAILRAGRFSLLGARTADEHREAASLVSAIVAFIVFSMSEPIIFSRFGWIAAGLLLALRATQERRGAVLVPAQTRHVVQARLPVPAEA
jgi:O-antigen/teichoic acid export membrane protein/O-antigen ligase